MNTVSKEKDLGHLREVEFSVMSEITDIARDKLKRKINKGSLLEMDGSGMSMLTRIFLQPGDVIEVKRDGKPSVGIVMWSIASLKTCRIQVRFVEPSRTI